MINDINIKALKHFGTTTNILEAGYILTSGEMLDFSGKKDGGESGIRSMDHREIGEVLDSSGTDSLINFMNLGNIRLNPESHGIDITITPTKEQIHALSNYINYFRGEVIVDISDLKGKNIKYFEYKQKTASNKIINDIMEFFINLEIK